VLLRLLGSLEPHRP